MTELMLRLGIINGYVITMNFIMTWPHPLVGTCINNYKYGLCSCMKTIPIFTNPACVM